MTLKENLKKALDLNPFNIWIRSLEIIGEFSNLEKLENDDLHLVENGSTNPGFKHHLLIETPSGSYRLGSNIPFPPIKEWYND